MSLTYMTSSDRLTDDINRWLLEAVTDLGESVYWGHGVNAGYNILKESKATFRLVRGLVQADLATAWKNSTGLWLYRITLALHPAGRNPIVPPSGALVDALWEKQAVILGIDDTLAWAENKGNDIRPVLTWSWQVPASDLKPDIRVQLL